MEYNNYSNSLDLIKRLQMKGLLDGNSKPKQEEDNETLKEQPQAEVSFTENNQGSLEALDYQALMNSTIVKKSQEGEFKTYSLNSTGTKIKINGETVTVKGSGKFEIKVNGDTVTIKATSNSSSISFSNKKDVNFVIEKSDADKSFNLTTSNGNDTIIVAKDAKIDTLNTSNGDDKVIIEENAQINTLKTGNGDDNVINYGIVNNIDTSNGDDTVIITESGEINTLKTSNGDDNVINYGIVNNVDTNNGDDVVLNEGTIHQNINTGNGNDIIQNDGFTQNISGGNGDDQIINNGSVKMINGGAGTDIIINNNIIQFENGKKIELNKEATNRAVANDDGTISVTSTYTNKEVIITYNKLGEEIEREERSFTDIDINSINNLFLLSNLDVQVKNITDTNDSIVSIIDQNDESWDIIWNDPNFKIINNEKNIDINLYFDYGNNTANILKSTNGIPMYYEEKSLLTNESLSTKSINQEYLSYVEKFNNILSYKDYSDFIKPVFFVHQLIDMYDLSDAVKSDIDMLFEANQAALESENYQETFDNYVSSQMVKNYIGSEKSFLNIFNETQVGDVIETNDGLFINDGNELKELNMTKENYLELFPPVLRYATQQGGTGDCYFIADLVSLMKNPYTYAKILQMINVDNNTGDITVTFEGLSDYPVIFNEGNLYDMDGKTDYDWEEKAWSGADGAKGCLILEQAFAIARFANEENHEISEIDIDDAMNYIYGGNTGINIKTLFGKNAESFINNLQTSTLFLIEKEKINTCQEIVIEYILAKEEYLSLTKELEEYLKDNNLSEIIFEDESCIDPMESLLLSWLSLGVNVENTDIDMFKNMISLNSPSGMIDFFSDSQLIDIMEIMKKLPDNFGTIKDNYGLAGGNLFNVTNNIDCYDLYVMSSDLTSNDIEAIQKIGLYDTLLTLNTSYISPKILDNLSEELKNNEISLSLEFKGIEETEQLGLVDNHLYNISNIDVNKQTVSVINPWAGAIEQELSYDEFLRCVMYIDIVSVMNIINT